MTTTPRSQLHMTSFTPTVSMQPGEGPKEGPSGEEAPPVQDRNVL